MRRLLLSVLVALTTFAASAARAADLAPDYFKGKTIRIIVGIAPGGLYDQHARLMSRFLGKHLPGNPTVIVENQPGAGSLKTALYIYNAAPKDGTVLGVINRGVGWLDWYERRMTRWFPVSDVRYVLRPVKASVSVQAA